MTSRAHVETIQRNLVAGAGVRVRDTWSRNQEFHEENGEESCDTMEGVHCDRVTKENVKKYLVHKMERYQTGYALKESSKLK